MPPYRNTVMTDQELADLYAEGRRAAARVGGGATGQRILELAKQAGFLFRTQNPAEQRRMLETVLSNCTFDPHESPGRDTY
jgi:hypothetical protein